MPKQLPGQCVLCGQESEERCGDLACPDCHKSVTWEDCISGEYTRRIRKAAGLYES